MADSFQRTKDFRVQDLGDEIMVFEDTTDQVHVLNHTAAFVWRVLEGPIDLDALEAKARDHFDVESGDDVRAILQRALDQLVEKGLAETVS